MKKLSILYKLSFLVILAAFFFPSCDPDPILTDDPSISLVDEAGFISTSTTIDGSVDFSVRVSASEGSAEMNSLTIYRDNVEMDASEFSIDGIATANNPQLLFDGDRTSFVYDITITPHTSGEANYAFEVTATDNGSNSTSIDLTVNDVDPLLTIDGPSSISVSTPTLLSLTLVGTVGSSPLSTISVFEDGELILDLTRLSCDGMEFASNPNDLGTDNANGFNKMFVFDPGNIVGTRVYTITITDDNGKEASVDYTFTLEAAATPFTATFSNVRMYNNSGPLGGAIDLDSGTNVSSADASADIVDNGLDAGNWSKTISPLGSTDLRSLDAGVTYDGTTSREMLVSAFDGGTSLSSTGELTVGSIYAAKIGDDYYLLSVATVEETSADNEDYFEFNIKQSKL